MGGDTCIIGLVVPRLCEVEVGREHYDVLILMDKNVLMKMVLNAAHGHEYNAPTGSSSFCHCGLVFNYRRCLPTMPLPSSGYYEYEQEEVRCIDFSGFMDTGDTGEKYGSSPALNLTDVPIPTKRPAMTGEVRHSLQERG